MDTNASMRWTAEPSTTIVLVRSEAVLVLSEAVLVLSAAVLVLSAAVLVLELTPQNERRSYESDSV
jgi:hypothetical protein